MLGARLTAAPRKGGRAAATASSPTSSSSSREPSSSAALQQPEERRRRRRGSDPGGPLLQLTLPQPPDDFPDRLLVGFFGTTVIGQLYTWPLALILLYAGAKTARAEFDAGRPALGALAALGVALLLLYLRFILGRGFREAEVTPNVLENDADGSKTAKTKHWWQRAPLRRWRQWARLRRFVGARLIRVGPPLDPSRAYVFAGFPHGISAISAFANLVVEPEMVAEEDEEEEEAGGEQEAQSKPAAGGAADNGASSSPSPSPSQSSSPDRHRGSFRTLFPGLSMHAMTLASNFKAPLVREYCLSLGLRPATRTSCAALLTTTTTAATAAKAAEDPVPPVVAAADYAPSSSALRHRHAKAAPPPAPHASSPSPSPPPPPAFRPAPGRAIFLAPGGAAEALLCRPGGNYDVLLARRKGFCRVALATGADVVPVVLFGETELFDVWHPPQGSLAWRLQRLSHRLFGTSQPIFRGEGLFGADRGGLLPRRWSLHCGRPRLTTVVGQPVRVEGGPWRGGGGGEGGAAAASWPPRIPKRGADPAFEAAVDALHARYCSAIKRLFEENRRRYHPQGAELRVADADDGAGGAGAASAAASSSRMQH